MFAFLVNYHLAATLELCYNLDKKEKELIQMIDNEEQGEDCWEDSWEPSDYGTRQNKLDCSTPSFERHATNYAYFGSDLSEIDPNEESYYDIRDFVSISSLHTTATEDFIPNDLSLLARNQCMDAAGYYTSYGVPSIDEMDAPDYILVADEVANDGDPRDEVPAEGIARDEVPAEDVSCDEVPAEGIGRDEVATESVASVSDRMRSGDSILSETNDTDFELVDNEVAADGGPCDDVVASHRASESDRMESPDFIILSTEVVADDVPRDEAAGEDIAPVGASEADRIESPDFIIVSSEVAPDGVTQDEVATVSVAPADVSVSKRLETEKVKVVSNEDEVSSFEEDSESSDETLLEAGDSSLEDDESSFEDDNEEDSSFEEEEEYSSYEDSSFEDSGWSFPPRAPPAYTLPIPKWVIKKPAEHPQSVEDIYKNPRPGPSHAPDYFVPAPNRSDSSGSSQSYNFPSEEENQRPVPVVSNEPLRNWIRASIPDISMPADSIWFPMPGHLSNPANFNLPSYRKESVWSRDRLTETLAREELLNHDPKPGEDRVALFFKHFELGTIPPPSKW
ncbi:uncharacterized protein LOC118270735 [Spodoptera frugiperda]|uniref:Uncharacterized protein LOC118270735 n=1 Tax=Spodoptera frugiperda TaxID=7108 RepID=A0A9R0D6T3_SPOFR|nr:uncharacterized protein LOC118270735 [Spodoptera frugiperda]